MTTQQQAQQLRLAADILETEHPYEFRERAERWIKYDGDVMSHVHSGDEIRLILATPPDGRPLHNPNNLTAEQVGAGYRLMLNGETLPEGYEYWFEGAWKKNGVSVGGKVPHYNKWSSCRVPLSIPWPEAKPDPYADEKKTVPLGPEDVPPGSVFRHSEFKPGVYLAPSLVQVNGVTWIRKNMIADGCSTEFMAFSYLTQSWQINRSLSKGQWNSDAWEPCHKTQS